MSKFVPDDSVKPAFYTQKQVLSRVGIGQTALYAWERKGEFPSSRQIGPNRIGYPVDEVEAWIANRPIAESNAKYLEAEGAGA